MKSLNLNISPKLRKQTMPPHLQQKSQPRGAEWEPHKFGCTQVTLLSLRQKRLIPQISLKAFSCCEDSMSKFWYTLITSYYVIKLYRSVVTTYTSCFMFISLLAAHRFYIWGAFGSQEEGHVFSLSSLKYSHT